MGLLIASFIVLAWIAHLLYLFTHPGLAPAALQPGFTAYLYLLLHVALQTYLYTGLFITAHDSMHGTVSRDKRLNRFMGGLATFLFAALSYRVLLEKHHLHHRFPASDKDPDYHPGSQNFWAWWFSFMKNYVSFWQFVQMAVIFNILAIWVDKSALLVYWILPSIASTLQLFYFGTYLPHRQPHTHEMTQHKARTRKKNHFLAMLTCYFFGYHLEHHLWPGTPWWKLYQKKRS